MHSFGVQQIKPVDVDRVHYNNHIYTHTHTYTIVGYTSSSDCAQQISLLIIDSVLNNIHRRSSNTPRHTHTHMNSHIPMYIWYKCNNNYYGCGSYLALSDALIPILLHSLLKRCGNDVRILHQCTLSLSLSLFLFLCTLTLTNASCVASRMPGNASTLLEGQDICGWFEWDNNIRYTIIHIQRLSCYGLVYVVYVLKMVALGMCITVG